MIKEILIIILTTLTPVFELRFSIPYGILRTDLHWMTVFLIAVITNALLGAIVYLIIDKTIHIFLRLNWFRKWYHSHVERLQKKIHKKVEKYGEYGIALFIGIPFPGTGSYSGAIVANAIGLGHKKFFIANLIGVLLAGVIVTIITLSGSEIFSFMIKLM